MYAILAALLLTPAAGALPDGAVHHAHERRGGLIDRVDGAAGESWRACAAACGYRQACQAWTYREIERVCDLHRTPATPRRHPGAVTGLSSLLAAAIEAASERAPDARERAALEALEHGFTRSSASRPIQARRSSDGLAGAPPRP